MPGVDDDGAVAATQLRLVVELERVGVEEDEMTQQDTRRRRRQQIDGATRVSSLERVLLMPVDGHTQTRRIPPQPSRWSALHTSNRGAVHQRQKRETYVGWRMWSTIWTSSGGMYPGQQATVHRQRSTESAVCRVGETRHVSSRQETWHLPNSDW